MVDRSLPTAPARHLLKLAQEDREAARSVMESLSVDQQVAAVCEAPLAMRTRLLDLCPAPEAVVPRIPEAELCFTCKAAGVSDTSWILAHATEDQLVACVDLDAWTGLVPEVRKLDGWMGALAEAGPETLLRAAQAMDPEMLALYLRDHVTVALKPSGDEDWEPPDGGQTLDGQFYFVARREGDDVAALTRLLHVLFERDYWLYFRMMQSVIEESRTEIEEWALRWRTGRLEDLGFPSWDRSMRIYGHLRPDRLAELPLEPGDIEHTRWQLPVWISDLPVAADSRHAVFRAAGQLDADGRAGFFYAFLNLANKVAVADRRDLGDADTLPETIEKAATVASRGLEHVASENGIELADALRRVPVEQLFRVGVNLDPTGVRPPPSDLDQGDDDVAGEEEG
jgi:hypothetical protein